MYHWGKWSKHTLQYIRDSNAFLNISVGSIRSGKTISTLARWLKFLGETDEKKFAMIGVTMGALKRNVLEPFMAMLTLEGIPYDYKPGDQKIIVDGKHIALFGLDKANAERKIQGYSSAGMLIDELTTIPQESFEMALTRNSEGTAKIFATCNPANPNHYVYKEYIQKADNNKSLRVFKFNLDDNLNLSEEYKQHLRDMYPVESIFYKRYIQGEWVSGHGAIYDGFTDENILDPNTVNIEDYEWIHFGSDYGVNTTTCYNMIGKTRDGEYHQIMEHVFDAKERGYKQTDTQRVDDLIKIQDMYNLDESNIFYVSHDAASLMVELERRKDSGELRLSLDTFKPNMLECIALINALFEENKFKICSTCKVTIKQVQGYEWNSKAAERGVDEPVQKDDHLPDGFRAPIVNDIKGHHILGGVVEW